MHELHHWPIPTNHRRLGLLKLRRGYISRKHRVEHKCVRELPHRPIPRRVGVFGMRDLRRRNLSHVDRRNDVVELPFLSSRQVFLFRGLGLHLLRRRDLCDWRRVSVHELLRWKFPNGRRLRELHELYPWKLLR